jgi:hypothetical protein
MGRLDSMRIEEHDLPASDDHAVVLNTAHYERGGKHPATNRVVVYHVAGDKITEMWLIDADQRAADEFPA